MRKSLGVTILLSGLALACAGTAPGDRIADGKSAVLEMAASSPREALVAEVEKRFATEEFAHAFFGVKIQSLDTDEVWYEQNSQRMFMPASNEKIPTTAAALLYLGPDFRYETVLSYDGDVKDNTIQGDVIVYGNGDPTIYNKFYDTPKTVFREWAKELKEKGITSIQGDIIGDDNAWTDDHTGNGWPLEGLDAWYYAEFGPLTFNENYVDVKIVPPATVDGEVELIPNVECGYFNIVNNIDVVADGKTSISFHRSNDSNTITFTGRAVAGSSATEQTPSITNPTLFYVTALKETLEEEGITVEGQPRDCDDIEGYKTDREGAQQILVHQSPPLSEIIQGLMKRSQNMYAESMIYTMGWKATGKGTFTSGRKVIQDTLKTIGVEPDEYKYSDGSGLSRYNYVSPNMIVKIYDHMLDTDYKDAWWEAQSIAGVDGTIRRRMKGTAAEGNMRGKTGMISNVRSLSGYVKTADGELLALSFLCNAHMRSSGEVDAIYDGVVEMLADYSAKGK